LLQEDTQQELENQKEVFFHPFLFPHLLVFRFIIITTIKPNTANCEYCGLVL
jgi:hypothetical protein